MRGRRRRADVTTFDGRRRSDRPRPFSGRVHRVRAMSFARRRLAGVLRSKASCRASSRTSASRSSSEGSRSSTSRGLRATGVSCAAVAIRMTRRPIASSRSATQSRATRRCLRCWTLMWTRRLSVPPLGPLGPAPQFMSRTDLGCGSGSPAGGDRGTLSAARSARPWCEDATRG